ncbi:MULTISPECIES: hypothetical protein [Saccharothrix]|uniref:hypothetical protein n=1 Tax=Saccharothrix TaxID=2071 RepID=UPI0009668CF2|nr:hypothetical protein [Saccharothrix sp. CB00851]OKI39054.1 hypothetical protein A6A25_02375 [Saccharothrix sp. CB00851]
MRRDGDHRGGREKLTDVTAATVETETVPEPEPGPDTPTLHQPKRALIAIGEVVLIALLVPAAVWCWNRGVLHYSYPVPDHPPLESTRFKGNWIGASVALVTIAGVLLLDALRQTVLAVRTRGRKQVDEPDV